MLLLQVKNSSDNHAYDRYLLILSSLKTSEVINFVIFILIFILFDRIVGFSVRLGHRAIAGRVAIMAIHGRVTIVRRLTRISERRITIVGTIWAVHIVRTFHIRPRVIIRASSRSWTHTRSHPIRIFWSLLEWSLIW